MIKRIGNSARKVGRSVRRLLLYPIIKRRILEQGKLTTETVIAANDRVIEANYGQTSLPKNKAIQRQMIEFMKCHRDLEHPSLSMSSLAVVLGPASSGKSLFLKSCLRELAQSDAGKGSRLIIHVDFSSYQFLTFDIFLEKFEYALTRKLGSIEPTLLFEAISAVFEVSLEASYLQILIRKVLTRKLSLGQVEAESNEQILALLVDLESSLPHLDVYQAFSTASALLFPPDRKQTTSSSGMAQMLREIALEKENWDNPVDSIHDEIRCSGIEFLDLSFDVLNFLSGYHPLRNHEEGGSNFHDVVLVVENLDKLFETYPDDPRPREWREHLIMRCYNEHSNRMHFPVVLESADSQFWSHELYLRMDLDFHHYPALDLMSPSHAQMTSWVAGKTSHSDMLAHTRYAFFAQTVYEKMKLIKSIQAGYTSRDIVSNALEREKILTLAKLYNGLSDPILHPLRDSSDALVSFKVANLLGQFSQEKHRLGLAYMEYGREQYPQDPLINALLRSKLLYIRRHFGLISLEGPVTKLLLEDVLSEYSHRAQKYTGDKCQGYDFPDFMSILNWNDEETHDGQRKFSFSEFGPKYANEINWNDSLTVHQYRL